MSRSLFAALAEALAATEIDQKLTLTATVSAEWQAGGLDWQGTPAIALVCGRPPRPELVPHRLVPQRGAKTLDGRARLLHAIVHIEFSAIKFGFNECKDRFFTFAV